MSLRLKKSALVAAVATLCAMPMVSSADAGDWILRAGASMVDPDDPVAKLNSTTKINVDEDTQFSFDVTWLFSKHFGLELFAAAPFNHGIFLNSGSGDKGFGEVEHLPPTLQLQWHMNPDGNFRPYVGVGGTYTMFSNEQPKGLKLDDTVGYSAGIGVDIGRKYRGWFLNLAAKYLQIESDATLNGAKLGTLDINPFVYTVEVGYLFGTEPTPPAPEPEAAPPPPPPPPAAAPAPADSDGDGVTDDLDKCPGTPAGTAVDSVGCPMIQTLKLLFDFDSAELRPESITELERVVKFMGDVPMATALVEGHTDSVGSDAYNLALSDRRAKAVFDYLSSRGVDPARLKSVGKGEAEPIADNKTAEGRQENRRVMLIRTDSR